MEQSSEIPPEQVEGAKPTLRADVWPLGTVIFEMVTGRMAGTVLVPLSLIPIALASKRS